MRWLALIKRFIAHNGEVAQRDLLEAATFTHEGGLAKARALFGKDGVVPLLDDLTEALVA